MVIRALVLAFASWGAFAAGPVVAQPAAAAPEKVASESSVEAFYAARANALFWFRDDATGAAADKLLFLVRHAELDGLKNAEALADAVGAAMTRRQLADDKFLSSAWVRYVQALHSPATGMTYGDSALVRKMPSPGDVLAEAARAPSLAAHVERIGAVNPLYAALRDEAVKQGAAADPRIRATLNRLRIIPATGRAILVDSASARLWMLEDGKPIDEMKVVVGKKGTPTPLLSGTIHYVTLNPYWNIPTDVVRDSIARLVLKRGVKYLKLARYETVNGFARNADPVDPESINWKAVADGTATAHVRQLPGGNNMMGAMKFGFANDLDIFLHDTPRRHLFAKPRRTLSLGCVRLEHADRLARWLLGREPDRDGEAPEQHVLLAKGVPIYLT